MKFKSLVFIGLGGAGQRHLRIFRSLLPEAKMHGFRAKRTTPVLNLNFSVNEGADLSQQYKIKLHQSLADALTQRSELAVISNPTSLHLQTILECLRNGLHVMVEKPLSHSLHGLGEVEKLARERSLMIYTGYQRRFNPPFQRMKELISSSKLGKIISVTVQISSYVPDWHKYESFKDLYACRADLGGGVLLTEVHEIDLCYWFFGLPKSVFCHGGNFSEHRLDVEDTVSLILIYENFSVNLQLSFMQKKTKRSFEVAGEKLSLSWTDAHNNLQITDHQKRTEETENYSKFGMEEMFLAQAQYLIATETKFDREQLNTAEATLKIVEAAKTSMKKRAVVDLD